MELIHDIDKQTKLVEKLDFNPLKQFWGLAYIFKQHNKVAPCILQYPKSIPKLQFQRSMYPFKLIKFWMC